MSQNLMGGLQFGGGWVKQSKATKKRTTVAGAGLDTIPAWTSDGDKLTYADNLESLNILAQECGMAIGFSRTVTKIKYGIEASDLAKAYGGSIPSDKQLESAMDAAAMLFESFGRNHINLEMQECIDGIRAEIADLVGYDAMIAEAEEDRLAWIQARDKMLGTSVTGGAQAGIGGMLLGMIGLGASKADKAEDSIEVDFDEECANPLEGMEAEMNDSKAFDSED